MLKRRWLGYLLAYGMWAVVLALGIWFLLFSRETVLGIADALMTDTTSARYWRLTSLERFYVIGVGLVWTAIMIISEVYFRHGVSRGQLLQRFARILGPELLLIFIADAGLLVVMGFDAATWSRWLILIAELALGVIFVLVGRSAPSLRSDLLSGE